LFKGYFIIINIGGWWGCDVRSRHRDPPILIKNIEKRTGRAYAMTESF